jgi:hypothetical protein
MPGNRILRISIHLHSPLHILFQLTILVEEQHIRRLQITIYALFLPIRFHCRRNFLASPSLLPPLKGFSSFCLPRTVWQPVSIAEVKPAIALAKFSAAAFDTYQEQYPLSCCCATSALVRQRWPATAHYRRGARISVSGGSSN